MYPTRRRTCVSTFDTAGESTYFDMGAFDLPSYASGVGPRLFELADRPEPATREFVG